MKKLNNSGFAHFILLVLVVALTVVGAVGFEVVSHAKANSSVSDKISCVLSAPTAAVAGNGYDLNVYITNNTTKEYTPKPVLTIQTFDDAGNQTYTHTQDFNFPPVAANATSQLNPAASGQWSLKDTDQKTVYTVDDGASTASCSSTVVRA